MSHLRVCLYALLVLGVGYGVSASDDCNKEVAPGSETTTIWNLESLMQNLKYWFGGGDSVGSMWSKFKDNIQAIFPGTKWCGDGNTAKNDQELGTFAKVDSCCREHDKCKYNIAAGATKLNLLNNGAFTRSYCECDYKFSDCLKDCNDMVANGIRKMYFYYLAPQCFKCVCPKDGDMSSCTKLKWFNPPEY